MKNRFFFLASLGCCSFWARIVVFCTMVLFSSMLRCIEAFGTGTGEKQEKQTWSIKTCMAMVWDDPFGALGYAQQWQQQDHSWRARYCQALALLYTGHEETAAKMLDYLAQTGGDDKLFRVKAAAEAAKAWLALGQIGKAQKSAIYGLSFMPMDQTLLILQARTLFLQGKTSQVIETLAPLVKNDKKDQRKDIKNPYGTISAEVFVLLASAERKMGQLDAALTHIQQALNKAPQDPVALLERGIIRERLGDMVGAKQDWQQVVAISPNSHEADMAQQDLDVMAADPESP
ncbi:MAG: hypothetical protein J6P29_05555 [Acetobacter sp.]|nr:hypothetical protein [Acetobacter sp.]